MLSMLTIYLIKRIGYDTHSKQMTEMNKFIFIAQFFNYGLIYLLVYANFTETFPRLAKIFRGPYPDYEPEWYQVVGSNLLVYTMIYNAFFPILMQLFFDLVTWLQRRLDQSCACGKRREEATKCTQATQYVRLYSG